MSSGEEEKVVLAHEEEEALVRIPEGGASLSSSVVRERDEEAPREEATTEPNAAQVRLRLFVVATVLWVLAGSCPFVLRLMGTRRESIVAVSEIAGCALSFACCSIIFSTYFLGDRSYRRHPNKLLVYKTACDAGLSLVVMAAFSYLATFRCADKAHQSDRAECLARGYLHTCDSRQVFPFFTQFFAWSSEAWFLIVSVDLRRAVKNPFYSFDSSHRLYSVCVWCTAAMTATLLIVVHPPRLYGLLYPPKKPEYDNDSSLLASAGEASFRFKISVAPYVLDFASCWVRDHSEWLSFPFSPRRSLPKFAFFYAPLIAVYLVAGHTLYVVKQRLARGLSSTFAARVRIAAVSVLTVLTYAAYWLLYAALVAAIYAFESVADRRSPSSRLYNAAFDAYAVWSFHRMTKCWWDLLVWLLANDPFLLFKSAAQAKAYCVERLGRRRFFKSFDEDPQQAASPTQPLAQPFLRRSMSFQQHDDGSVRGDDSVPSSDARAASSVSRPRRRRRRLYDEDGDEARVDVDAPLRPQTNDAMQKEVLYYVTSGIRQAARASATARTNPDDRPINLKRRDTDKETIHLSLARLLALFFVDDDLGGVRRELRRGESTDVASDTASRKGGEDEVLTATDVSPREDSPDTPRRHSSWSTHADRDVEDPLVAGEADSLATAPRRSSAVLGARSRRSRSAPPLLARIVSSFGRSFVATEDEASPRAEAVDEPKAAEIVFVDHKPQTFGRVRDRFGVGLEDYVASFRSTQKERFTEGGSSDAFFFFSGDERYLVKTCTATEFFTLLAIAGDYTAYVCDPPNSATFLVRLLGAHCLRLYETAFYFLVMENILKVDDRAAAPDQPVAVSQTRFDIKGSWINRTMAPPRPGQRLTCRHCNRKYSFSRESWWRATRATSRRRESDGGPHAKIRKTRAFERSESGGGRHDDVLVDERKHDPYDETFCPVTVGGEHAPNLTLKDNDLNYSHRLRLTRPDAEGVVRQLGADARFLASLGIMDYSLLLGVRTVEYPAPPDDDASSQQNTTSLPPALLTNIDFDDNGLHAHPEEKKSVQSRPADDSTATCRRSHVVVRHFYYFGASSFLLLRHPTHSPQASSTSSNDGRCKSASSSGGRSTFVASNAKASPVSRRRPTARGFKRRWPSSFSRIASAALAGDAPPTSSAHLGPRQTYTRPPRPRHYSWRAHRPVEQSRLPSSRTRDRARSGIFPHS